jgi:hypothetical protein
MVQSDCFIGFRFKWGGQNVSKPIFNSCVLKKGFLLTAGGYEPVSFYNGPISFCNCCRSIICDFLKNIVSLDISQNALVSNSPQSMVTAEDVKLCCQKKRPIIRL